MSDLAFIKPPPFQVSAQRQAVRDGKLVLVDCEVPYTFDVFVAEHIWTHPRWNEDESWGDAQVELGDAIEAARPGEAVPVSLEHWEKLLEAVKAAKIGGVYAHRVRRMARAVLAARPPADEVKAA